MKSLYTHDLNIKGMPLFQIFHVSSLESRDRILHEDCESRFKTYFLKLLFDHGCFSDIISDASKSFDMFSSLTDNWREPRRVGFEMARLCYSQRNVGQTALRYLKQSHDFKQTGFWNEFDDPFCNFALGYKIGLEDCNDSENKFKEILIREINRNSMDLSFMLKTQPTIKQPSTMFFRCVGNLANHS